MTTATPAPRGLTHLTDVGPRLTSALILGCFIPFWLLTESIRLFEGWSLLFDTLSGWFGIPASVVMSHSGELLANIALIGEPAFQLRAEGAIVAAVGAFVISLILPVTSVPARYALRAFAVLAGVTAVLTGFLGFELTTTAPEHLSEVFKTGYWFLLVAAPILALTGLVLPGNLLRKVGVLLIALLFLYLTIPLLALFHLQVLALLGLVWMPLLNMLAKVLFLSFELIAFYGVLASRE